MDTVELFFPFIFPVTFLFKITVMFLGKIIKAKQLGNYCHLVVNTYYCTHMNTATVQSQATEKQVRLNVILFADKIIHCNIVINCNVIGGTPPIAFLCAASPVFA